MRAVGEALGLGRTFAGGVPEGDGGARGAAGARSRPTTTELVARAAEPRAGALGPAARGGAARARAARASIRTSPTGCGRSRRSQRRNDRAGRRGSRSTRARASSRRARRTTTSRTRATTRGPEPSGRAVIVLGGGPNRIGQAIEFDYCCVHAAQALRKLGYEAVLVNSNPETVSTDYDTSDRLYLEPLRRRERARRLRARAAARRRRLVRRADAAPARAGARRGGRAAARRPARRDRRRRGPRPLRRSSPATWRRSGGVAENAEEAREVAHRLGYPVLVRPHHVLGGRGMHVAHSADELRVEGPVPRRPLPRGRARARRRRALRRRRTRWVAAVLEHVEPTGVHSGDSACVFPGPSVLRGARGRDPRGRVRASPPGSARAA